MYKTIAILIALCGLVACSSSNNPSDLSGQMGLPVAPPAGAAGTAAPPQTIPAQGGMLAPPPTNNGGSMEPPTPSTTNHFTKPLRKTTSPTRVHRHPKSPCCGNGQPASLKAAISPRRPLY